MNRFAADPRELLSLASRTLLVLMLLAAPVFALPVNSPRAQSIIEAPNPPAKGIGFVLLMTLQRR